MQISVSDLKLYTRCPRAYKLHEIDGVETQHKTLSACRVATVRKAMAELHGDEKKPCDFTKEEVEAICERIWQKQIDNPAINKEELDAVVVQEKAATKNSEAVPAVTKGERTVENIKTWCFEYSREEVDAQVLYSNIYFQTVIGDTTFVGYIDLVRRVPDLGLQIIIFNTSSQIPSPVHLERDFSLSLFSHAIWQGTLYPHYPDLTEEMQLQTIPTICVYYFPNLERYQRKNGKFKKGDRKGNPLINVQRTKESLLDFEYELLYAASGIQSEFFPMMPSAPCGCSLCSYAHGCNEAQSVSADVSFDVEEYEEEVA